MPTPRLWLFVLLSFLIWYYYEDYFRYASSIWEWGFEKAQRSLWFWGVMLGIYILIFQRKYVHKLYTTYEALSNDPRLNNVSVYRPTLRGNNHKLPGTRTKYKRNVSALLKKKIAANQMWKCSACNKMLDETYEVDHIVALEHGGSNAPSNLRALCPHCHRKKTVDERLNR